MKNQKGFSLIELLVVVIIIAIIAAIAIPSLLSSRRAANEANAAASLRTVNSAEQTYFATEGNVYAALADLETEGLIDRGFTDAAGLRGAHTFAVALNADPAGFCATATTADASSKSYATSHRNQLYFATGVAAPTCDAATGDVSTGTAVGN